MVGAQVAIIFVGGKAFSITHIDGVQWAICVVLAALCLPWAIVVRLFPDPWFAKIAHVVGGPVAKLYRMMGRGWDRLMAKMPKRSKKAVEEDEPEEVSEEKRRPGSDDVPEIVVEGGEKDGAHEVDLEAGKK